MPNEPDSADSPAVLAQPPSAEGKFLDQHAHTDDLATIRAYYAKYPDLAKSLDPLQAKQWGVAQPAQKTAGSPKGPGQNGIPTADQEALQQPLVDPDFVVPDIMGGPLAIGANIATQAIAGKTQQAIGDKHPILGAVAGLAAGAAAGHYMFPATAEQIAIKASMPPEEAAAGQAATSASEAVKPATASADQSAAAPSAGMTGDDIRSNVIGTAQHLQKLADEPGIHPETKEEINSLKAAVRDPETGQIYKSTQPGTGSHADAYSQAPEEVQARLDKDTSHNGDGYDLGGKYITRQEGVEHIAKTQDVAAKMAETPAPGEVQEQPQSVGAAALTDKRSMEEDLSVAHTMPDMIARAQATPLSREEFQSFEVGHDVDEGHYTLTQPINMIDALRISHYAGQQYGALMDSGKAMQQAIDAGAENPTLTKAFMNQLAHMRDDVLPRWSGMRHQIGLALRVLGKPTSDIRNSLLNIRNLLSEVDDSEPGQVFKQLQGMSAENQTAVLKKIAQPGFFQHFATLIQAQLLGPNTAVKKAGSDLLMLAYQPIERYVGAAISQTVGSGELTTAQASAWLRGVIENVSNARAIGAASERADKPLFDSQMGFGEAAHKALGSAGTSIEGTPLGYMYDFYANLIHELGGRRIIYPDQMAKYLHYSGSVSAQAMEKVEQQLGADAPAAARDELWRKLRANATPEMQQRGYDDARAGTFSRQMQQLKWVQEFRKTAIGKILLPFFGTPVNIGSKALQYTGLGPLSSEWRADFSAGGARADLATARQLLGSGLSAAIAHHYLAGSITGARPGNPELAKLWTQEGHQPYALSIGDHKMELGNLPEPLGDMFAIAVDTAQTAQQLPVDDSDPDTSEKLQRLSNIGQSLALAVGSQVHNMSFFKTISNLLSFIGDRSASPSDRMKYIQGMSSMLAPTAGRDIAHWWDPIHREVRGNLDQLMSEIPGVSKTLPSDVDLFGRDAMYPLGSAGNTLDLLSSPKLTGIEKDPVTDELLRLNRTQPINIPGAPKSIMGPATGSALRQGVPLTPEEQHEFKVLRGTLKDFDGLNLHDGLQAMFNSDNYKEKPDTIKHEMVDKFITMRHAIAIEHMTDEKIGNQGLLQRMQQRGEKRSQLLGVSP